VLLVGCLGVLLANVMKAARSLSTYAVPLRRNFLYLALSLLGGEV
jgi:hypothetical protein